jgi:dolichol kinase
VENWIDRTLREWENALKTAINTINSAKPISQKELNRIKESLKENKKWIIGLYALFIICFIASWMLSSDQISTLINSYNITPSVNLNTNTSVTPIDLFIKNESVG